MTLKSMSKSICITPRFRGDGLSTIIRKSGVRWQWRLLCSDQQIASGYSPTQRAAIEEIRIVKAKRLGKPEPEPLKPRKPTRKVCAA